MSTKNGCAPAVAADEARRNIQQEASPDCIPTARPWCVEIHGRRNVKLWAAYPTAEAAEAAAERLRVFKWDARVVHADAGEA